MDIVFICDEEYAIPTAVAIKSIEITNTSKKKNIYVISPGLKKETINLLNGLSNPLTSVQVRIYNVNNNQEFGIEGLHVSPAAIIKFDIAEIFKDKDKILYLDSDILVRKDLEELYSIDIDDCYAGVVKDYKPLTYNPSQLVKLNLTHEAYFNSGVMLLNLKKLREDNIRNKLYTYRAHGINYFMDQDALNVVFEEKVKYIDLKYNVISSTIGALNKDKLSSYYALGNIKSKNDIYNDAVIIHLTTKYKPWAYVNVPYSSEWMAIYKKMFKGRLVRKILDIKTREKIFAGIRVRISSNDLGIKEKVFVNLTSFPARIKTVDQVIRSLQKQTIRVDKIVLWLAETQFPDHKLPDSLTRLIGEDFIIKWCDEDLRPHKKYYYAFKEQSDSINITVDDDIYYDRTTLESLLISYIEFPFAVSANRAHQITFNCNGKISPYSEWRRTVKFTRYPSLNLFATGVGGVLYPPNIFSKDIFDIEGIKINCLDADDVWLKLHELASNVPVVLASENFKLNFVENSQEVALWKTNDKNHENDSQIQNSLKYLIEEKHIDNLIQTIALMSAQCQIGERGSHAEDLMQSVRDVERKYMKKIDFLKSTKSYKIGRMITYIPRLLIREYKSLRGRL